MSAVATRSTLLAMQVLRRASDVALASTPAIEMRMRADHPVTIDGGLVLFLWFCFDAFGRTDSDRAPRRRLPISRRLIAGSERLGAGADADGEIDGQRAGSLAWLVSWLLV